MSLRRLLQVLVLAFAMISNKALAGNYTLPLTNNTGLDPSQYSLYVMGFSTASNLVLGPGGTLVAAGGTVSSYKVGSGAGEISAITLDTLTAFNGGRFYFFVVPAGGTVPSVTFGQQPPNPGTNTTYPPYSIVEITVPAPVGGVAQNATIDVQTVDGFVFPITTGLNGLTTPGNIYGQPVNTSTVNRAAIFSAYTTFMQAEGAAGAPYLDMVYNPNSVNGQAGGILNPGAYLTAQDSTGKYLNLDSSLHAIFNTDLNTLFSSSTLKIQGVTSNPAGVVGQAYTVAPVTQNYADGTPLPALKLTGVTDNTAIFYIFNPVGVSVLTNDASDAIVGSITTVSGVTTLTLASTVSALQTNMYVSGAGLSPNGSGQSVTKITQINGNVLTLGPALAGGDPAPNQQYSFSKQSYLSMFLTPGQMVFGNSGFFADSAIQIPANAASASVLASLENFFVAALNRGIGVASGALNPVVNANNTGTSQFWGTQTNWYPAGSTQNLFSLFMHTAAVSGTPIFLQPANATTNARSQTMGAAYGFAYDENGGPVPPAPTGPEVPSKFDGTVTPGSTIQVTFGPWTGASPPPPPPAPTPNYSSVIAQSNKDLKALNKDIKKTKKDQTGSEKTQTIKQLKFAKKVVNNVLADPSDAALVSLEGQVMKAAKIKNPQQREKKFKKLEKQYHKLT